MFAPQDATQRRAPPCSLLLRHPGRPHPAASPRGSCWATKALRYVYYGSQLRKPNDGHSHTLRAKEKTMCAQFQPPRWMSPRGWARLPCVGRERAAVPVFFRGASVDGGRLALEQSWCSRVSSASRRLRRASPTSRTHRGVCGQRAAAMSESRRQGGQDEGYHSPRAS